MKVLNIYAFNYMRIIRVSMLIFVTAFLELYSWYGFLVGKKGLTLSCKSFFIALLLTNKQ